MSFSTIGLSDHILQGVYASGYSSPTEIQQAAIPLVLQGRDIIGCAPTGTGKTAAFVLPILAHLEKIRAQRNQRRVPRALILTPTRELAQQIEDAVVSYGTYMDVRPLSVYGGVGMGNQLRQLRRGVDIIIATPGRLLDHMERRSISLGAIEILVLDEADRMYDMGFIRDVRRIISQVPAQRQTLLFSATMSSEVRGLVAAIQKNPHTIEIGEPFTPVDTVSQHFYSVTPQAKMNLLLHILKTESVETMLVFSRTKHGADRIAKSLEHSGIRSAAIHANRTQNQRQKALDGFKRRFHKVLVATDIAARGIDVDDISHVVNFDTPVYAEDYIHRIGRTGRAEAKGSALTFVSSDEERYMKRIEYLTRKRFELKRYPGFLSGSPAEAPAPAPRSTQFQRQRKFHRAFRFA
jgi:ATP-dependent RNA helicase RhlE